MEKFVDNGFLSGDTGAFDDRGRLFLTGRLSSFVNVAGRKVDPSETENVLLAMPDVLEAKVARHGVRQERTKNSSPSSCRDRAT